MQVEIQAILHDEDESKVRWAYKEWPFPFLPRSGEIIFDNGSILGASNCSWDIDTQICTIHVSDESDITSERFEELIANGWTERRNA